MKFHAYGGVAPCKKRLLHQTFLVMRLTFFFLFAAGIHVSAKTFSQRVHLTAKNIGLDRVLTIFQQQSGYSILWNQSEVERVSLPDVDIRDVPLTEALDQCFKDLPFSYSIKDNLVLIHKRVLPAVVLPLPPPEGIHGKVLDSTGRPLAGASVRVKGTRVGTQTDAMGAFSLPASYAKETLLISYVNYETLEVGLKGRLSLVVQLKPTTSELDETVIKGYYSTTQRLNTGNVSKVTAQDIADQPVTNVLAALDGRVPGMEVTQTTGIPGGAFNVEVRGRTAIDRTITDDQPLFVVDGIPLAANNSSLSTQPSALGDPTNLNFPGGLSPFNSLNPSDVESIEVLKDADATSIYGSRGANGVILITTKKGRAGKTKIDANVYSGFSKITRTIDMMNTPQYLAMRRQAFANDSVAMTPSNAYDVLVWDTTRYHNFPKMLGENPSHTLDANLSVSGGSANTQFLVGAAYHHESTVLPGNLYDQRISAHFNLNHTSDDKRLRITLSANYANDVNDLLNADLASYWFLPPNLILYDSTGKNLAWNEGGYQEQGPTSNPLAYTKRSYIATTNNLTTDILVSYNILRNLSVKVNAGYNNIQTSEVSLSPASAFAPGLGIQNSSVFSVSQFNSYIVEPQAEYNVNLGPGKLQLLAGGTIQSTKSDVLSITGEGYSSEDLMQSLTGATALLASRSASPYLYQAAFGRIGYNVRNKYLVNFTGRRDGSSRFGSDKQWADFGSAGAAWIFSEEPWIKKLSWLSFGKLRGSYGITGNDKISNYQFLDTWATTTTNYNGTSGLYPNKLFNPDYHWEKTDKLEEGLEMGFLHDRFLLTLVHFDNYSSNQLVQYKLPYITGFASVVANLPAKVRNSGWEVVLTTTNLKSRDFSWTTNFNITIPKNVLTAFPGLSNSSYKYSYVLGQSLNLIYKYKYTGVDPQTGLYTFRDVNKDGNLDQNDYQVSGNLDPKYYGGLGNSIRYKGFQLDFLFSFRKQMGMNYLGSIWMLPGDIAFNLPTAYTNTWTHPGQQATLQRLTQTFGDAYTSFNNFTTLSNGVYGNASFVRLKNVSLGYTFPASWSRQAHMSLCRIYLQAENLFTFTSYQVGDPETQNLATTPPLRTIVGGIQITL